MAVKKAATPKKGTTSKPATKLKAAQEVGPKKATAGGQDVQADGQQEDSDQEGRPVKLSDAQLRILSVVHQTKETPFGRRAKTLIPCSRRS
jgi:hypothetical protein